MSVPIKIELTPDAQKAIAAVGTLPERILPAVATAMDYENQLTVALIQRSYLSFAKDGPTSPVGCRVISNRLRNSIRASAAIVTADGVTSAIGSNVVYAAAQEFGADIPAHTVYAKPGGALRFVIAGKTVFAKSVKIPAVHLPARGFVQQGIEDRAADYTRALSNAIERAFNE